MITFIIVFKLLKKKKEDFIDKTIKLVNFDTDICNKITTVGFNFKSSIDLENVKKCFNNNITFDCFQATFIKKINDYCRLFFKICFLKQLLQNNKITIDIDSEQTIDNNYNTINKVFKEDYIKLIKEHIIFKEIE